MCLILNNYFFFLGIFGFFEVLKTKRIRNDMYKKIKFNKHQTLYELLQYTSLYFTVAIAEL